MAVALGRGNTTCIGLSSKVHSDDLGGEKSWDVSTSTSPDLILKLLLYMEIPDC